MIVRAVPQEFFPPDDFGVRRYFFHLAPFCQIVALALNRAERVLDAGQNQTSQLHPAADIRKLAVELIEREADHTGRLAQAKFDLRFTGQRMHHIGDRADLIDRIEHDDGLRRVRHADRDAFALFDTDGYQCAGAFIDLADKVLVAHLAAHEVIGDVARIVDRDLCDLIVHAPLIIVQMCRHPAEILQPGRIDMQILKCFHHPPPHLPEFPAAAGYAANILTA